MRWNELQGCKSKRINSWLGALLLTVSIPFLTGSYARCQDPQPEPSAKPPAKQSKPAPKPNKDSATQSAPDQPTWDPLRAEKDLEVGQYYMKKGDYDAAIDRFNDAIQAKPGFAVPFKYLGEAQEKKRLKKQAIKSYRRYLDLVPHAEDAGKVQRKLDKLYKETEKEKK